MRRAAASPRANGRAPHPRRPLAGPAWLALLLLAAPLAADYRQAYVDGVRALRAGATAAAVTHLTAALAERPDEQTRARLVGVIPEPYLPHHYLGLAYFALRRCPEALREWEISTRLGAVAGLAAQLEERRQAEADCRGLAEAEEAIAAARAIAARSTAIGAPPGFEPAASAVESAAAALAAAVRAWDLAALRSAARRAVEAGRALAALAPGERDERPATAPAAPRPPETPPPGTATAGAPALGAPPARESTAAGAAAAAHPPETNGPPAAAAPESTFPAALVVAVQAYFDGDYALALQLLARPETGAEPAGEFFVHLFGAAARQALYLLGGGRDAALLAAAGEEARQARRLRPAFAPDERDFSPRFVAFYASSR